MPHRHTAETNGTAFGVPGNDRPRKRRRMSLNRLADLSLVTVLAVLALMAFLPVPYLVQTPGPTVDVLGEIDGEPAMSVTAAQGDAEDHPPQSGSLELLTVGVSGGPGRELGAVPVLTSWISSQNTVVPTEMYYPVGTTRDTVSAENAAQMSSSQEVAVAAALTELDIPFERRTVITGVEAGMPADGALREGDRVLAVDGQRPAQAADVVAAVQAWGGEEPLRFEVDRAGSSEEVEVTPQTGEAGPRIGALLADDFDFPVQVDFHVGDIGGPSAGLIFSLAVIDHLTPGDLTGGAHLAGTGEITVDGHVGAIGGARQKAFAAHARGAEYFLSPAGNCQEVVQAVDEGSLDDMRVIRVDTLDDAVSALEDIAASDAGEPAGLPECQGTP